MEESMIGKKVRYRDETWEVVHVTEGRRAVIVQIGVDVKMGAIRVDPVAVMVNLDEDEIEEIPHELTAKEYAGKLRAVFGAAAREIDLCEDIASCDGMRCEECPFSQERRKAVGYSGSCDALAWYRPDLAVKLMDEWQAEKNKPKGKTYLQDFREKMPNAYIDPNFGTPAACRKRMYYHEIDDLKCGRKNECSKCWNEEMPEVSDNAEG